jgi:hypothetical protein
MRGKFDTCLAAALVYDEALHAALISTLVGLRPERLILCNSAWSPAGMQKFHAIFATHFECNLAHTVPADHNLGGGGYAIHVWECVPRTPVDT